MGVHHAEHADAPVALPHEAAGDDLGHTIKANMRLAGFTISPGRQARQDSDLVQIAPAKQDPADFLFAALGHPVGGIFAKHDPRSFDCHQHALQRLKRLR